MSENVSRRKFAQAGLLSAAFPLLLPRRARGANNRIRVGVIGAGAGARSNLLMDQLPDGAEIVAVADCYRKRSEDSAAKRKANWRIYDDHRELLDQKDIDGVIVGTNDHGRVLCSIHAVQAGKDVYAEKPLSLYVAEGRVLVRAVRKYNRILQVGSQQRSMAMNRLACDFVRNGGLGRIRLVLAADYPEPVRMGALPEEPMPVGMNWDMWLGQTLARPFNQELFAHWMRYWDYSGGEMTNWGAHGVDQIQSALGMDTTGPVEFWPLPEGPRGAVAWRYANGVEVRLELPDAGEIQGGGMFIGERGRIEITRNDFRTDPPNLIKELPPQEEIDKWKRAQWQAKYHMQDWLDSMRSRKMPLADVEVGHRSISVCHIANITRELSRKLHWDPEAERFTGDAEANDRLNRKRRKGYELPESA
ncbi:MAG: Gfo/Idh/MocA family oxidoreductase [Acidobacteriia bacterium]|nr:Gfo/Idh/MocA family oxidoreductase [Terriglobia bacterium]